MLFPYFIILHKRRYYIEHDYLLNLLKELYKSLAI